MAASDHAVFEVIAEHGHARAGVFHLHRHDVRTPVFMPVGTQGAIKGLTAEQLLDLDLDIILGNTYHLGLRPGIDVLKEMGGLHQFMQWPRNILTDSGGFQMVSLLDLAKITEEGVEFLSAHDGERIMISPEESIKIQTAIGSDIMMQLDDVVHVNTQDKDRVKEAMERSIRWLDRCISAQTNPKQQLFAIIQGALDLELRTKCVEEMTKRNVPGFAIGGLSGGEAKDDFWRTVVHCTERLPKNKPRYCMGVGYPVDLVVCSLLGVDMFDCVYPCRTARFGSALTSTGKLQLKSNEYKNDFSPLDDLCQCLVCKNYTRSMLHTLTSKEQLAANLLTYHNLYYLKSLMTQLRKSIIDHKVDEFVSAFMARQFKNTEIPQWVRDALEYVGVNFRLPVTVV